MDFDESPEEAAFRAEAHDWLKAHAPYKSTSDGRAHLVAATSDAAQDEHVRLCREWQRTLYDGGWAGITWPKEFGGRGGTGTQQGIFNQEQAKFDVHTGAFAVAIGMVGPTLIAHGTDEQKELLDPMLRGEHIWCQLFSEPGAGSDLAGLTTRAVLDGDEWVVNGQKVWTTFAQYADYAILLTRTDLDVPKHKGITYFLLDMKTPGIEIRPLRQIDGRAHFNEVFLSDVRIPAKNVLGTVNAGWGPILTTIANERTLIGGGTSVGFDDIVGLARAQGRNHDPLLRQRLAEAYTRLQLVKYLGWRAQTATSQGRMPGAEASVMKLAMSDHVTRTGNLVLALEGPAGMLAGESAPDHGFWQGSFLGQWAVKIGGGTDQIQRNTIGERVLGLPPEARPDKTANFRDLPKN